MNRAFDGLPAHGIYYRGIVTGEILGYSLGEEGGSARGQSLRAVFAGGIAFDNPSKPLVTRVPDIHQALYVWS
jgi:hypothetical protein